MSFDSFDISASGLYAQRLRMDTIAGNIANINTTRDENGKPAPYVRKQVTFSTYYKDAINEQDLSPNNMPVGDDYPNGGYLFSKVSFDDTAVPNGVTVNKIEQDKNPYKLVYDPSHPDANKDGFVQMPNINIVTEMVDMMSASKAYEANVTSIEAAKGMVNTALRI